MDTQRLTKLVTVVNIALILFVLLAMTSSVTASGRSYDDVFPVVERRVMTSSVTGSGRSYDDVFPVIERRVMASSVTGSGRSYDDVFPVVERRAGSPACRRCVLNRNDWSSCTACFRYARRGSARIPYYGLRKRSSSDDDVMATPRDVIECCAETGNPECCRHVGFRRERASVARLPIMQSDELASSGPGCSCCDLVLYDVVCCQAGCNV